MRRPDVPVIKGTNKSEDLFGTDRNDTIYGRDGDDRIVGYKGDDSLHGDRGNDVLWGYEGDDNLYGKNGDDTLIGGVGNDKLYGDDGQDSLWGGEGNDILKGGLGGSYMNGEGGDDSLYFDPYRGRIEDVIDELSGFLGNSSLHGGDGHDILNIFGKTTYTDAANAKQDGWIYIGINEGDIGSMFFEGSPRDSGMPWASLGTFDGIEEIRAEGNGGLKFHGGQGQGFKVTGTAQGDDLSSFGADDWLRGGGGNDSFFFNGGDRIESWTKDADEFYFADYANGGGAAVLSGFNGAGKVGGDVLNMSASDIHDPSTQIVEADGHTIVTLNSGDTLEIDAVGLKQDLDYFIV
jgi:Ca2+-binding RTX toxin-like protein